MLRDFPERFKGFLIQLDFKCLVSSVVSHQGVFILNELLKVDNNSKYRLSKEPSRFERSFVP